MIKLATIAVLVVVHAAPLHAQTTADTAQSNCNSPCIYSIEFVPTDVLLGEAESLQAQGLLGTDTGAEVLEELERRLASQQMLLLQQDRLYEIAIRHVLGQSRPR